MHEFQRVIDAGEVPDPGKTLVEVEGEMVALFHVGGQFYALDVTHPCACANTCPTKGRTCSDAAAPPGACSSINRAWCHNATEQHSPEVSMARMEGDK